MNKNLNDWSEIDREAREILAEMVFYERGDF